MTKKGIVTVVGIGRVGLPLSLVLANAGYTVYGVGRDPQKIARLQKGSMPFMEHKASGLLKKYVGKQFHPTTTFDCIKRSTYIILTLGTPVDENMNPLLDQIIDALETAKQFFKPGQTLILRSTVSPKTTQYVKSFINSVKGLEVGRNFYLAFCPERIAEGNSMDEIKTIPQIIGGVDIKSGKRAQALFRDITDETLLTDDVSAELAKLFTNMYRYINFAIANEFMVLADNYQRDIHTITSLVNHNYKRGGLRLPGMTGGPCLFKDGFFLIGDLPFADLISTSWRINESVPLFLIKRLREQMPLEGKKVVILGLAFKSEIDDIRESLSFKVRKGFLRERASVVLHDPYVKEYENQQIESDVYTAVTGADVVFVATNHKQYMHLDMKRIKKLVKKDCMVCDVWNVFGKGEILYPIK